MHYLQWTKTGWMKEWRRCCCKKLREWSCTRSSSSSSSGRPTAPCESSRSLYYVAGSRTDVCSLSWHQVTVSRVTTARTACVRSLGCWLNVDVDIRCHHSPDRQRFTGIFHSSSSNRWIGAYWYNSVLSTSNSVWRFITSSTQPIRSDKFLYVCCRNSHIYCCYRRCSDSS